MNLLWEEVEPGLFRSPVPSGWIVRQCDYRYNDRLERWEPCVIGVCFVPDEAHVWANNAPQGGEVWP
jgi:hypothetical protein